MDVIKPKEYQNDTFYWVGIPLTLFVLISAIFLWIKLKENEIKNIYQQVNDATTLIINPIENTMQHYMDDILRLGDRWVAKQGTPENEWYRDAGNYLKDTNVFHSILWVDKNMRIQWVVPVDEKPILHGIDLSQYQSRYKVLNYVRETRKPVVSNILNLIHGPKALLIIIPLYKKKGFDGYIIGSIDVQKFFHQIFNNDFGNAYGVAIYDNGLPVFKTGDKPSDASFIQEKKLTFYNIHWTVYVWPTEQLISKSMTILPQVVLLSGILASILILLIFYFYNQSIINSRRLVDSKRRAEHISKRLQKIIKTVNEGFISFDRNGTIIDWNPYAEKILGWSKLEALGKNIYELVIPERNQKIQKDLINKFIQTGETEGFNKEVEFKALKRNGEEFPVDAVIFPIHMDDAYTFHAFVRDITSRKKAEDNQFKLISMINTTDDAIACVDLQGNVMTWNHGAEMLFGFMEDEMIGQSIMKIYPKNKIAEFNRIIENAKKNEHAHLSDTYRKHKDGHNIPVSITVTPMKDKKNNVIGYSSNSRDITERKKIEKMKNEFISVVSHELRTPLTSIRGSLGLLGSKKLGILTQQGRQLLDIANNNCERLIRLINDILDIERIEAGKIEFNYKELNLNLLVAAAISSNQGLADKFHVTMDFNSDDEYKVMADEDRITQVVTNLLSNAIHYSYPNEVIKLRMSSVKDRVRVSINNVGPEIPQEFHNRIFGKFSQADSSDTRRKSGSGLGLNISKAIIEKHGGTISFTSTKTSGTTFYFELDTISKHSKDQFHINNSITVLVCDSNKASANYLKNLLQSKNIEVDVVNTAKEAMEHLEKNVYSAITVDLALSDQDGVTFIRNLRNHPKTKNLPVVVISVETSEGKTKLNGDGIQVIDWIEKPIDLHQSTKIIDYINQHFVSKIPNILNVEDDVDVSRLISIMLHDKANVWNAHNIEQAKQTLKEHAFDLIILDLNLPDGAGTELLPCINYETNKAIPIIIFSVDELDKKYSHLVKEALLKSKTSNEELFHAIEAAINKEKKHEPIE